jgi:pyrimidine operon attenuation protein/uracil phosphoribosyltransferase
MDMNLSLEGKNVVLIDDVLFTGRSIRSAIDALMAFGRPKSVELLTLIDRRFSRDLPIQPNYVGKTIDAIDSEKVIVEWKETTGTDRILMIKSE